MEFKCKLCNKKFSDKKKVIFCKYCDCFYCLECNERLRERQKKKKKE